MKRYILCILITLGTLTLNAQCVDNGNYWNESWVSCTLSANPNPIRGNSLWILYEFQEPHAIDSTYIWNANRTGESGWGAKDVIIDYSPDGTSWVQLGQFTFPQAPETTNYTGFLGPEFDGVFLEKILITVLSTHSGGSCASIAEIQFKIDQTACFGVVDACGICDGPGIITWYQDNDNDGLGDPNVSIDACIQPAGYVEDNTDACDNGAVWSDMAVLFQDNGCMGCHGAAASGGLDLRTYASASAGGNICGTNLLTGTTLVDIMTVSGYSGCGTPIPIPAMNDRTGGQFDAAELAELQTWIDAGASELCAPACATLDLDIQFDGAPTQTSWEIMDTNGVVVTSGGTYASGLSNSILTENACLPDGCYDLVFYDSANDGMCPRRSSTVLTGINIATIGLGGVFNGVPRVAQACGNYTLTDINGAVLASGGGRFGSSETTSFCLTEGTASIVFEDENIYSKTANDVQIRIVPNIVNDQTMLYYSVETNEDIYIQITDVTGKTVQQYTRNPKDINELQLNASHLESGFYYVQLVSGKIMLTEKFVKMN